MRRFANFYIVLFLIAAGLSLANALWALLAAPLPALATVHNLAAFLVSLLSLIIFSLLGIDRRLPKRIFLPLTLYAFWCSLGLWPLLGMIPRASLDLTAAGGQLFVGVVALLTLRRCYRSLLLPDALFQQQRFSWRNTLIFSAVNLLLFPVLLVFSLMATTGYYLDQQTAGFMRLSPFGVYTSERRYHHDGKVVRLVAMMHIARKGYYQELVASLPAENTIVLVEGVTDQDRLLQGRFHYGRLASMVGLSSQETMRLDGNLLELDDLQLAAGVERDKTKPDMVRADLDLNQFEKQTVAFLNVIGRTLLGGQSLQQGLVAYPQWAQAYGTPELLAGVLDDILDRRNAVVIDTLRRSLERYDTVVVPWGGMHMPAIEAALLDQGFVLDEQQERQLFAFSGIPLAALWQEGALQEPVVDGVAR